MSYMNWLLLALIIPLALCLLLYDIWVVYRVSRASEPERIVVWGGLNDTKSFYTFIVTFCLSSFGCVSSFVLFVTAETTDVFIIFVFMVMNASYLIFNYGLLLELKNMVVMCLWTNIYVFIVLFIYTILVFKMESDSSNLGLLVGTHICNAVAIFHVTIIDIVIWYDGWVANIEEGRRCFSV